MPFLNKYKEKNQPQKENKAILTKNDSQKRIFFLLFGIVLLTIKPNYAI
jgi:hypothetical protein